MVIRQVAERGHRTAVFWRGSSRAHAMTSSAESALNSCHICRLYAAWIIHEITDQ